MFKNMKSGECLDQFHQRCVVPTNEETVRRNADVDQFVRFLHGEFNDPPYTVAQVVKAGSLGKGTAVRGSADIDLVVFLNGLSSVRDLENARPRLLRELENNIKRYEPWRTRVSLGQHSRGSGFSVALTLDGEDMDILPACNAVRMQGHGELYRSMANYPGGAAEGAWQFSASLAPLQIDFVKPVGEQVKTVIRLVKFWKKERGLRLRSYTVELITIHAARSMGMWSVTTQRLFENVLRMLQDCGSLKVAFNDNYNSGDYARSAPRLWTPPYVMDPANPYVDTLAGVNASQVSRAAADTLQCL